MHPEWLDRLVDEVLGILSNENEDTAKESYIFQIRRDPAIGGWSVRIFVSGFVPVSSMTRLFEGTVDVLTSASETSILGTVEGTEVQLDFDFNEPVVRRPAPVGELAPIIDLSQRRGRRRSRLTETRKS